MRCARSSQLLALHSLVHAVVEAAQELDARRLPEAAHDVQPTSMAVGLRALGGDRRRVLHRTGSTSLNSP